MCKKMVQLRKVVEENNIINLIMYRLPFLFLQKKEREKMLRDFFPAKNREWKIPASSPVCKDNGRDGTATIWVTREG